MAHAIHDGTQLAMFEPDGEVHDLTRMSHVGMWWRGYCTCGWLSRIVPDRWRVEAQHRGHLKQIRKPWHELGSHTGNDATL